MLPRTTLVLGGAASGKSAYAESLVLAESAPRVYLATAQAFDDEMRDKIQIHMERRQQGWTTVEAPYDIASELKCLDDTQVCLLDCATMWLSNQMLAENDLNAGRAVPMPNALANAGVKANKTIYSNRFIVTSCSF